MRSPRWKHAIAQCIVVVAFAGCARFDTESVFEEFRPWRKSEVEQYRAMESTRPPITAAHYRPPQRSICATGSSSHCSQANCASEVCSNGACPTRPVAQINGSSASVAAKVDEYTTQRHVVGADAEADSNNGTVSQVSYRRQLASAEEIEWVDLPAESTGGSNSSTADSDGWRSRTAR